TWFRRAAQDDLSRPPNRFVPWRGHDTSFAPARFWFLLSLGNRLRHSIRQFGRLQFVSAVGAKPVRFGDLLLAVGAARGEVAFAAGAEVEARTNERAAARAGIGQRFADEQIDDQSDDQ